MAVETGKYLQKSIERVMGFDIRTNECVFVMEDLQNATIANTQDSVEQTGKNGAVLAISDRNKRSTLTAANGMLTDGALAVQIGAAIQKGTLTIGDHLDTMVTANGTTCVTEFTAQGDVGDEIGTIYKSTTDGSLGQKFTQAAAVSATEFTYNPATKTIALPTGAFAADESVTAFYSISATGAKRITNDVEKYSATVRLVADVLLEDFCDGKTYLGKFTYPRAKCDGNFDLAFGEDTFVHSFSAQAMYSGCNIGGEKVLWELSIVDSDDVA